MKRIKINYKPLKELLSSQDRWCQEELAKDEHGNNVRPRNPNAVRFCLLGAIIKLYESRPRHYLLADFILETVKDKIRYLLPDYRSLSTFNDTHSFEDIKAILNKLPDEEVVDISEDIVSEQTKGFLNSDTLTLIEDKDNESNNKS